MKTKKRDSGKANLWPVVLPVNLASHAVFAGVVSFCNAGAQHGSGGWTNHVNYWGKTGRVKHPKMELLAFSVEHATCKKCLKVYRRQNASALPEPSGDRQRRVVGTSNQEDDEK